MSVLHLLWANLRLRWAEWWQPSAPDLCDRIRRVWQAEAVAGQRRPAPAAVSREGR